MFIIMTKLTVKTSEPYDIYISEGILQKSGELIGESTGASKVAIITDSKVDSLYGSTLENTLDEAGINHVKFTFPNGEKSKNLGTYVDLMEKLGESGLNRSDAIVALGGGVCGDMGGFLAATLFRGIKYVQVPTTYLASVDSSVGGKTGVDLKAGKNLAGAFWQPSIVICDYSTFSSLDETNILSGKAEAIKSGMIGDISILDDVLRGDTEEVIRKSVTVKKQVVEADERDTGERQKLNFGHTIGHSIEQLSSFGLAHGIAVAKGMLAETRAAERLGISDCGAYDYLSRVLTDAGYDLSIPYSVDEIMKYAVNDKKVHGSYITVVYPDQIGHCSLYNVDKADLKEYVKAAVEN